MVDSSSKAKSPISGESSGTTSSKKSKMKPGQSRVTIVGDGRPGRISTIRSVEISSLDFTLSDQT